MKVLDLDAVRAFVQVADLLSFTRAADALGTTQSAVSLKIKRLEAHLGKPLLERTPRSVRLSPAGGNFVDAARELLLAHDKALGSLGVARRRLRLGLSEHICGADLPKLVASLHRQDPQLVVEMRLGLSAELLAQYEERQLDAVIVRQEAEDAASLASRGDGRLLFVEPISWLAAPGWQPLAGEPLPVAVLAAPCGVRSAVLRALDRAGIAWQEAFVGGGIAALGAAIEAGLAVGALAKRVAPPGVIDVGGKFGLPTLPASHAVVYSRVRDTRSSATLDALAAVIARG